MKTTVFHPYHVAAGAKMVPFAGFEMPIQYPTGILEEHRIVRNKAGVFDVSHMGEFEISGRQSLDLVQKLTTNDASKLTPGKAQYSAMCRPSGNIIDDLIVYKLMDDEFMLVVNGANVTKDFEWVSENALQFHNVEVKNVSDEVNLLAVQGPKSLEIIRALTNNHVENLAYYTFLQGSLAGVPMIISRTGYTGEIGFELYFRGDYNIASRVVDALWSEGGKHGISWIGLGARDTLRLEKGYCLYGNDINESTNPIEAGLGWITKLSKGDFNGKSVIEQVKAEGPKRLLVGFVMRTEKLIPRHGYEIIASGHHVGAVTSGNICPGLGTGIGLGYVGAEHSAPGTIIEISARGSWFPAMITKTPFV
jgi:aminomethyltransferase